MLIACSDSSTAYDRLLRRRFPIVFFDRIPQSFRGTAVTTDNFAGGYQAARHLMSLGHSRIAIIAGQPSLSTHAGRLEGFRKAMQESVLPIRDEYCRVNGLTVSCGFKFPNRRGFGTLSGRSRLQRRVPQFPGFTRKARVQSVLFGFQPVGRARESTVGPSQCGQ